MKLLIVRCFGYLVLAGAGVCYTAYMLTQPSFVVLLFMLAGLVASVFIGADIAMYIQHGADDE